MLGIGGKGRFLGEYELTSPRGLTISKLRIGGSHAMMKSILGRYQTVLVDEDILGRVPRRPAKIAYAGDATCNSCHAKAHTVWTLSRHAHAMETLRRVKHQLDPECVVCHVTGLDVRGGYTSRTETPALARVSCESCHGPGGKHVKTEQKADILRGSEATCRGCHTVEHDPHFDIKSRWKKIAH